MYDRVRETADDFKFQIEAKQEEIKNLGEEKNRILFGSDGVEETVRAKTAEKDELEEYITKVSQERTELSKNLEEMTAEQVSAFEKLNSYQDQKYREEIKLAKNETKLDTFKEKL